LEKINSAKGFLQGSVQHDPKFYQLFFQMWTVIFSYLTFTRKEAITQRPFLDELVSLASLTPHLVYVNEFFLMLRPGGTNREVTEGFIDLVYQKYPALTEVPLTL
jgi:hypothetical protein